MSFQGKSREIPNDFRVNFSAFSVRFVCVLEGLALGLPVHKRSNGTVIHYSSPFFGLSFAFEQQGKSEKWLNFGKIRVRNNV